MALTPNERAARWRARKRGETVEPLKRGPKPGYVQSREHVEKRKQWGEQHPRWVGDAANIKSAYKRAHRRFQRGACTQCGNPDGERHHIDGNPRNNILSNIAILCRACHVAAHRS